MVLECLRLTVDASWQDAPDGNQQNEPHQRKNKKGQRLYFIKGKKYGGHNSKNIDQDQQDLYFRPGEEVVTQRLDYLFLIISKMYRHKQQCDENKKSVV